MDELRHAGFILSCNCGDWGCVAFVNYKNCMDMIGHDYIFIYLAFGEVLRYRLHTGLRNGTKPIQLAVGIKQTMLFVCAACNKVIVDTAVIISRNPCRFPRW